MPRVTIWIREEDLGKWEAIDDIPRWLHEHLNTPLSTDNLQATIEITKKVLDNPRTKATWCKEHEMEKEFCKGFKHKGAA